MPFLFLLTGNANFFLTLFLFILFFCLFLVCLKGREEAEETEKEEEEEEVEERERTFLPVVHSLNVHSSQDRISLTPRSWNSIPVSNLGGSNTGI